MSNKSKMAYHKRRKKEDVVLGSQHPLVVNTGQSILLLVRGWLGHLQCGSKKSRFLPGHTEILPGDVEYGDEICTRVGKGLLQTAQRPFQPASGLFLQLLRWLRRALARRLMLCSCWRGWVALPVVGRRCLFLRWFPSRSTRDDH